MSFDCGINVNWETLPLIKPDPDKMIYEGAVRCGVTVDRPTFERAVRDAKSFYDDGYRDGLVHGLEAADEYRWHDLRKDPEDLPTENKMYIVTIKSYSGSLRTDFMHFGRTKVRGKIVGRWKYPWGTITNEEITHWMERPQAAGGEA